MKIKLSQWAKENGYTYQGAYTKFRRGDFPNATQDEYGTIRVDVSSPAQESDVKSAVLYCRCSSSKQKDDLERQVERLMNFATNSGYVTKAVYKEIASGMNDARKELLKMLSSDLKGVTVIVEHKDRLTRFGFNYLKLFVESKGGSILVVNEASDLEHDLTSDLIAVVTSFCAKLYGTRKGSRKTEEITKLLENDND